MTSIYFVRHAESAYVEGKERTRGLTLKGSEDSEVIKDRLINEDIDYFISSPYQRSIDTITPTAKANSKDIAVVEDLRERSIGEFEPLSFYEAKQKVYEQLDFSFPGGESSHNAQKRAVRVIEDILDTYEGKKIVIGTHGDIMTLMMSYYDDRYDFDFWQSTTMPDIYKLKFEQNKYISTERLWSV